MFIRILGRLTQTSQITSMTALSSGQSQAALVLDEISQSSTSTVSLSTNLKPSMLAISNKCQNY